MKKAGLLLLVLIVSIQTMYAHNPLSAMYYLEVKEDISILNISLSQTGLNEALKKHFSKIEIEQLSSITYKQLAVKYLKENFYLNINGTKMELLEGGIKLGNHQSDVKFIIDGLPKTFKSLNAEIKAFKENDHHQTIFSLLLNGNTSKVILNQNNNYTASVTFKDNVMLTNANTFNKNYLWFIGIIPIFLFGRKFASKTN